jgi:hypothetical protein
LHYGSRELPGRYTQSFAVQEVPKEWRTIREFRDTALKVMVQDITFQSVATAHEQDLPMTVYYHAVEETSA